MFYWEPRLSDDFFEKRVLSDNLESLDFRLSMLDRFDEGAVELGDPAVLIMSDESTAWLSRGF